MNILLAVDDSTHSRATAQFLNRLHFPQRSQLVLLTIVEPTTPLPKTRKAQGNQASATDDYKINNARDLVNRVSETCWKPELKAVPLVETGIPGSKILDVIEQYKIDLTVVGTHGLSGRQRFLLGSVSEWVLTEAPCSVLIVRGQSTKQIAPRSSGMKIVMGVDGSDDAKAAVRHISQLKFPASTQVTLCSIMSEPNTLTTELKPFSSKVQQAREQTANKMLDQFNAKLEKAGLNVHRKLAYGHPAEQLLTLAEQQKCDLIVVGSRGVTGLRKFFLGSVSNKVACHAPCSVLVVRKPFKS